MKSQENIKALLPWHKWETYIYSGWTGSWGDKFLVVNNSLINNNWRWLHPLCSQHYTWSDFVLSAPGHTGWNFGSSNVSHSWQPKFFRTFRFWLLGGNLCGLWCLAYGSVEAAVFSLELLKYDWVLFSQLYANRVFHFWWLVRFSTKWCTKSVTW